VGAVRQELSRFPDGGGLNIAYEAVDRHVEAGLGRRVAIRWMGKDGAVRDFTYAQLKTLSDRFANVLSGLGVGKEEPGRRRRGRRVLRLCFSLPTHGSRPCRTEDHSGLFHLEFQTGGSGRDLPQSSIHLSGETGSLALVMDPFGNPRGFRLPIVLGGNYFAYDQEATASNSAGSLQVTDSEGRFGAALGVGASVPAGKYFRVTPFLVGSLGPGNFKYCSSDSGSVSSFACNQSHGPDGFATPGVTVSYRPWDVSFVYVYDVPSKYMPTVNVYSLTWAKHFDWTRKPARTTQILS
jgi:hypothetical protein